jgi:hypothetical protein
MKKIDRKACISAHLDVAIPNYRRVLTKSPACENIYQECMRQKLESESRARMPVSKTKEVKNERQMA